MAYRVLARKWRPHAFSEIVGQDTILRTLRKALESGRIHHALLFSGTRGVGKTTLARLVAKSLSCEQGICAEPCQSCAACQGIDQGRFIDLIEVDAASRTRVEDTVDLLEKSVYAPAQGRFRIYLIDEVHMLSGHSFNALLKTLEEPPDHLRFLFATTEPQRLPITVLSRCLQLPLRHIAAPLIASHLQQVLQAEGIAAEDRACAAIARAADGSMRDALSLLEQAISFSADSNLRAAEVSDMLGELGQDQGEKILSALAQKNAEQLLQQLRDALDGGVSGDKLLASLLHLLHQIALVQQMGAAILVEGERSQRQSIVALSRLLSPEDVQLGYDILLQGRRDLLFAPDERTGVEIALLRMLCFCPADNNLSALSQVDSPAASVQQQQQTVTTSISPRQQRDSSKGAPSPAAPPNVREQTISAPATNKNAIPETTTSTPVANQDSEPVVTDDNSPALAAKSSEPKRDWTLLVASLPLKNMSLQLAKNCALRSQQNSEIWLELAQSLQGLLHDSAKQEIQAVLSEYYGHAIQLHIKLVERIAGDTVAEQEKLAQKAAQKKAENDIDADPVAADIRRLFDATIKADSIKPR